MRVSSHDLAATPTPVLGRDRLINFIWSECLKRSKQRPDELPIIELLGPRGSGKSAVLDHLADSCRAQDAQPFTPVLDLAANNFTYAWQIVDWCARQLSATSWRRLGRLRFPRFALGRIIAEGAVTATSLGQTERDIEALLRRAAGLRRAADKVQGLAADLPKMLGLGGWGRFIGRIGSLVIASRLMVRLRWRTGMAFYGAALQNKANGGFLALVSLSDLRQHTDPASRATVDRVLCEAFLADLADVYRSGFRPRNCLVLVDNIDDSGAVGKDFLGALARARFARAGLADPLVTVVASRRTTSLAAVLGAAAIARRPIEARLRPDTAVSLRDWKATWEGRPDTVVDDRDPEVPDSSNSMLYPVRLLDLDRDTVVALAQKVHPRSVAWAGFVYSLTRGNPWGVRKTLDVLLAMDRSDRPGRQLGEHDLRNIFEAPLPGHDQTFGEVAARQMILADLPRPLRSRMPACAAGLDVVTATLANLAKDNVLETELAKRLWLIPESPGGAAVFLHPWPRRLLLHKLARSDDAAGPGPVNRSWTTAYEALRQASQPESVAAYHYEVAMRRFDGAVDWLMERFSRIERTGPVTAEDWIRDVNTITSAGHDTFRGDAVEHHERLLDTAVGDRMASHEVTRPAGWSAEKAATVRQAILNLVTARSIWTDPLGDPMLSLGPILDNDFRTLALACPPGERRLITEAEFYKEGGRP